MSDIDKTIEWMKELDEKKYKPHVPFDQVIAIISEVERLKDLGIHFEADNDLLVEVNKELKAELESETAWANDYHKEAEALKAELETMTAIKNELDTMRYEANQTTISRSAALSKAQEKIKELEDSVQSYVEKESGIVRGEKQ